MVKETYNYDNSSYNFSRELTYIRQWCQVHPRIINLILKQVKKTGKVISIFMTEKIQAQIGHLDFPRYGLTYCEVHVLSILPHGLSKSVGLGSETNYIQEQGVQCYLKDVWDTSLTG